MQAERRRPGLDWSLLETGSEECGFVLQIAVSLRNVCNPYLTLSIRAITHTLVKTHWQQKLVCGHDAVVNAMDLARQVRSKL
jgi:hypothetical protein